MKQAYTQQYLFGMGGTRHMGPSDWGALGNILRRQYAYMAGFEAYLERQLAAGRVPSAAYMQWRMGLYLQSSRYAFERAHVTSYGLPRNPRWGEKPLPVFPAEPGATECGSNCGCSWQIVVQPEQFECYWELDDTKGKHCEDCIAYNITYYPLVIPRTYYDAFGNEQDVADAPPELWEFLDDGIEGYDLDLYGDVY